MFLMTLETFQCCYNAKLNEEDSPDVTHRKKINERIDVNPIIKFYLTDNI